MKHAFIMAVLALASGATVQAAESTKIALAEPPTLSLGAVTQTEGNSRVKTFQFPVTLSAPSEQEINVKYTTADGTAIAGKDYSAENNILTIPAGATSAVIPVMVLGDSILEDDETFLLRLSDAVTANLANAEATATIQNDDTIPGISISDTTVAEGGTASFAVTLSKSITSPVTVSYRTGSIYAREGEDFIAASGTVTIPAGETSATINVETLDDEIIEASETFKVNLTNPVNALLVNTQGTGTITSDELPELFAGDVSIREGDSSQRSLYVTLRLSEPTPYPITVDLSTSDGTAKANLDYAPLSSPVTIYANSSSSTVVLLTLPDTTFEVNEYFFLNLKNASGAIITTPRAKMTLVNDDAAPSIHISDVTMAEGNANKTATFTVSLSAASWQPVTVGYATTNGTATAGSDYVAASGIVSFTAGQVSKTISVTVNGDTTVEGDETFFVNLSNPVNATIADGQGSVTLTNDDAAANRKARKK